MNNLIVYFNFESSIYEMCLPAINNRKMSINLTNKCTSGVCIVDFEVWDNLWQVKGNEHVRIQDNSGKYRDAYHIEPGAILHGYVKKSREQFTMIVTENNAQLANYAKLYIKDKNEITIGNDPQCDIVVCEEYISRKHLSIYKNGSIWLLRDTSSNGTFVNNKRVKEDVALQIFDEIYIVGTKIIFLGDILAINNTENVSTPLSVVNVLELQSEEENNDLRDDDVYDEFYFSRSPREIHPLNEESVEIEAPPQLNKQKKPPLIFTIGPSITMPLPIMLSVVFNMNTRQDGNIMMYLGTLISVVASAAVGLMWTLIQNAYNKKQAAKEEEERVDGYKKYIKKNKDLLESRHNEDREILNRQYVDTARLIDLWNTNKSALWNRNVNHSDFLTIRLGTGKVEYPGHISIPKERFSLVDDVLLEYPRELYDEYKNMSDVSSVIDLKNKKLIGVIGNHSNVLRVARNMIVQIAALHCYTDVKIACLYNAEDNDKLEWIKWLPHTFSSDRKERYVGNDAMSQQNVMYSLLNVLRTRDEEEHKGARTHYVVFCTEAEVVENENIYSYMISEKDYGFTFVLLYDEMNRLPNECKHIIQISQKYSGYYVLDENRDEKNTIVFDNITVKDAEKFARTISGVYVKEVAGGEIPTTIDFMEMMQIANLEQWDLIKHYKENRVYENIRAMLGVTNGNKPLYLDIHEKKAGPHGLVAGTTGSGKSETIMTFILSLLMNYRPDEVAFVLIDYKGGGMAAPFIGLPHVLGTITNIDSDDESDGLDESQTRRALISIKSEIKRRQKIFNRYKVNHIDAYIKLFRAGEANEPLPHLIIISDEFAELKKEQPEFIKELVSAARVGRSLGIHLILATQKPAGVVDDEIWSNSRFKLCLRVQDKQDSLGMLKRPEAAYITGTGRGYMQIGNDEIFEMFQSGYAGAVYEPKDKMELSQHNEVKMISLDGAETYIPKKKKTNRDGKTQLDACIEYIKRVTQENGIVGAKQLWLPALPKVISYKEIIQNYDVDFSTGFIVVYGLVDYPENQMQYPATVDLLQTANIMIAGSIGMGKTTLLQTMLYSLCTTYNSDMINLYVFDFSSRTLKIFGELPHCGDVAFSEDNEKISRNVKLILDIMETRKALFDSLGVGSYREARKLQTLPMIILAIDNYAMFKEYYPNDEEQMGIILREGVKYGIQVIVTVNSENDIGYRIRQNFSVSIPLYYSEKGKYMDLLGASPDILPRNIKGRGLIGKDVICEFQTAIPVQAADEFERNQMLVAEFKEIAENDQGTSVHTAKVIPQNETYYEYVTKNAFSMNIPLGYDIETVENILIDMNEMYCYAVTYRDVESKKMFYNNMRTASSLMGYVNYRLINLSEGQQKETGEINLSSSCTDLFEFAKMLKTEFTERNKYMKTLKESGQPAEEFYSAFARIIVFIDDLKDFVDSIYDSAHPERIHPIMETFISKGRGLGIYFVANIKTEDHYDIFSTDFGKIFRKYRTGIHFGGRLDEQRMYSFNLSVLQQMKEEENNVFYQYNDEQVNYGVMPNPS